MNKAIKNAKISINVIMPEELSVIAFIVGLKNGENIWDLYATDTQQNSMPK